MIRLLVFTFVLACIAFALAYFLPAKNITPVLFFLFPFFFSSSALVFNFLVKSTQQKFNRFVNRFMMATFVKLMAYLAILVTYVFTYKSDAVPFIFAFFILYLTYTVFEVVEMLKYNKTAGKLD